MYWERQKGNLCRLHSLNAFFGKQKISEQEFQKYCEEYDKIVPGLKTDNMDGFANGWCIINWILFLHGFHSVLIPIEKYKNREFIDIDHYKKQLNSYNNICEFNEKHVWLNKKNKGQWFKIDSITGISQNEVNFRRNGFIIVFNGIKAISIELDFYIKNILKEEKAFKENNEILWHNFCHAISIVKSDNKLIKKVQFFTNKFLKEKENKELYCLRIISVLKQYY